MLTRGEVYMETNRIVRNMRREDIEQVYAIETCLFSMPWSKEDFTSSIDHPQNMYLVVDNGGKIAGYCGLWSVLDEGQITNVAVDPAFQNQGIGSLLIGELLRKGRERGLTAFTLEVRESNKYAIQLYKKYGFEEAGIRPNFYEKPTENALIMWCYF